MNWLLKARMNMIPAPGDAKIPILAGTDTGFPFVLPGFGLHQEVKLLADAGLTPFEAIRTATINPAKFMRKQNKLGSVEKGKLADLIIVNKDPTQNIQNLTQIESDIVNGKLYSRAEPGEQLNTITNKLK